MARVGRLGMAALAGLVVVDVVLVGLAVLHVQGTEEDAEQDMAANASTRTPGTDEDPEPDDPGDPEPADPGAAGTHTLVDIGDGDAVARATSGVCGEGGAKVELSVDGGSTFEESPVPSAEVVLRIASTDIDETWLVATDANCESTSVFTTTNGGGSWSVTEGSGEAWHTLAEPAASVNAPTGEVDVPCAEGQTVASLSTLDTVAAFSLCGDGTVLGTSDGGTAWDELGSAPGASDLDFIDTETGLAVAGGDSDCAGVAVLESSDGGASWEPHGCIETDTAEGADVSATSTGAYVSVGSALWYSSDGGSSWDQRTSS